MSVLPALSAITRPETAGIPYITTVEFENAPTGLDLGSLVSGGTQAQQTAALAEQILRASSWMDLVCHQVLAATTDTEVSEVRVDDDGGFTIFPRCFPVRAVTAISLGWDAESLTPLTTLSNVLVRDRSFRAWYISQYLTSLYGSQVQLTTRWVQRRLLCQYTYVNGYPVTTLSAPALQGATSVSLASVSGIVPGMTLTFSDNPNDETATVSSSYTFGASPVPVSALAYAHAEGVAVSSMPWALKQHAIDATGAYIREKRRSGIVMSSLSGAPAVHQTTGTTGASELARVAQCLMDEGFVARASVGALR